VISGKNDPRCLRKDNMGVIEASRWGVTTFWTFNKLAQKKGAKEGPVEGQAHGDGVLIGEFPPGAGPPLYDQRKKDARFIGVMPEEKGFIILKPRTEPVTRGSPLRRKVYFLLKERGFSSSE